jgi:hypothetical protein
MMHKFGQSDAAWVLAGRRVEISHGNGHDRQWIMEQSLLFAVNKILVPDSGPGLGSGSL